MGLLPETTTSGFTMKYKYVFITLKVVLNLNEIPDKDYPECTQGTFEHQ